MTIGTPVNLGTLTGENDGSGSNSITTIANIPAGSLVVVGIVINSSSPTVTVASVSDGTNTYTKAETTGLIGGFTEVSLWYCGNAAAVGSGGHIVATYSGTDGIGQVALAAAYIPSGVVLSSGLDQIGQGSTTGSNTASATTPALSQAVEIAIGAGGLVASGVPAYNGATGFTNIVNAGGGTTTDANVALDFNIVNAPTAITYGPTWAAGVSNFRAGAAVATFKGWATWGWEVQPPQPFHPAVEKKYGAIAKGHDGVDGLFNFVPPTPLLPWQVSPQEVQPPALRVRQRIGGVLPGDAADQNDLGPIVVPFPEGWAVQPPQPPAPQIRIPNQRAAATMRGDDGNYDVLRRFFPLGFPIQPPQPNHPVPEKRAAAIMRGDDGVYDLLRRFIPIGWPVQPPQPNHPTPERRGAATMRGDDGTQAPQVAKFSLMGWETQPPQPPRWPRYQVAGAIMRGLDSIEAQLFVAFDRFGLAIQNGYHRRFRMPDFGDQGIAAPIPRPFWGWEAAPPVVARRQRASFLSATSLVEFTPPAIDAAAWYFDAAELIRYRRPGPAIEIEPSFDPMPAATPWGYDHQESMFWRRRVKSIQLGETFVPTVSLPIWGYEAMQPIARRRRILTADQQALVVVPTRTVWGYEIAPTVIRTQRRTRASVDRGYELITSFPPVWTSGWEIQPPQPPHPRRERAGTFMRGPDGTESRLIVPFQNGWESVLLWPPHPRPERAGGVMLGDIGGAWGPFVYLVPSGAIADDFAIWFAASFDIGQPP